MAELDVRLWRGDGAGRYQRYRVPRRANQTVLDVVTWVQRHLEPTLAYRFACRVGVCGSCAMTVNGRPRWTCRSHVAKVCQGDRLEIGPLRNLPVIRDLAVDMSGFFDTWQGARGRFQGTADRRSRPAAIDAARPDRRRADAAIECINCAVCYSACETVAWRPGYLGPAALNRAWTLANDARDGDAKARRAALRADDGVFTCHSHGACSEHCPVGLDPAASIAGLKRWALTGG